MKSFLPNQEFVVEDGVARRPTGERGKTLVGSLVILGDSSEFLENSLQGFQYAVMFFNELVAPLLQRPYLIQEFHYAYWSRGGLTPQAR